MVVTPSVVLCSIWYPLGHVEHNFDDLLLFLVSMWGKGKKRKGQGLIYYDEVCKKKKIGKNVNLPVLIWFAWSTFKKAPNGCKCIAWACFTEKWQFISHTGNIVMFPHGTPITFTCCWIVKLARDAAQNFAGTTNEFIT